MSAVFNKLDMPSLQEAVLQSLLGKILSGQLKPGEWLPAERDMAEQMGVSRSSLHQAILSLNSRGFLRIVPRRGTMVIDYRKHPTPQSLETLMSYDSTELDYSLFDDMMSARVWLETECVRRACTNIYESTMLEMQQLIDEMKEQSSDLSDLVYRFHYQLTQASGNSIYSMIFRGFEPIIRKLISKHYDICSADRDICVSRHQRVLDAIAKKDESMAEAAVIDILSRGIDIISEKYEKCEK